VISFFVLPQKSQCAEVALSIAANEKVFAMAGYSLNVQPEQMLH
jgi:hypothetical protein